MTKYLEHKRKRLLSGFIMVPIRISSNLASNGDCGGSVTFSLSLLTMLWGEGGGALMVDFQAKRAYGHEPY